MAAGRLARVSREAADRYGSSQTSVAMRPVRLSRRYEKKRSLSAKHLKPPPYDGGDAEPRQLVASQLIQIGLPAAARVALEMPPRYRRASFRNALVNFIADFERVLLDRRARARPSAATAEHRAL